MASKLYASTVTKLSVGTAVTYALSSDSAFHKYYTVYSPQFVTKLGVGTAVV